MNTCVVSGVLVKGKDGADTKMKVAHIVPRKARHDQTLMNYFGLHPHDLNKENNLLYMTVGKEFEFDKLNFCFVPTDTGTFEILRVDGSRAPTRIHDDVSRKMLMIHAMDFHRHHGFTFDPAPWKSTEALIVRSKRGCNNNRPNHPQALSRTTLTRTAVSRTTLKKTAVNVRLGNRRH